FFHCFFFQAEDGIRDFPVTGVQTCALPILLTLVLVPLRIGVVWLQRRLMFGEQRRSSLKVALALSPTLVFTLVLANILYVRFDLPAVLFGALILYTVLNTLLPSLVLRAPFDVDPIDAPPASHPEDRMREDAAARPPRPPVITG